MGRNRIERTISTIPFNTGDTAKSASANTAATLTYAAISVSSQTAPPLGAQTPQGLVQPQTISHAITGFLAQVTAEATLADAPIVTVKDGSTDVVFTGILSLKATGSSQGLVYELDVKFPLPRKGTAGRSMILTIPAQGANTKGYINVYDHWTEIN